MKVSIKLKNKQEIIKDFTKEEYEAFRKVLMSGRVKKVEIDNQIIDCDLIAMIEPIIEPTFISKEFRLPEKEGTTTTEEERELKKINIVKRMDEIWYQLKSKGLFKEYNTPDEYRNRSK